MSTSVPELDSHDPPFLLKGATEPGERLSGQIAGTLRTSFAMHAMLVVSGALIARLLGVHGRGLLAAITLWPSVLAFLGDLGGPNAYVYLSASNPRRTPMLVGNAILVTLLQSAVIFAVGVPLVLLSLHRNAEWVGVGLIYLAVYVPWNLIGRYLNAINQGAQDFRAFNRARIGTQIVYLLAVCLLFTAGHRDLRAILVALVFALIIGTALAAMGLYRRIENGLQLSWTALRNTFHYGLLAHFGNLTPIDSLQLDVAVVIAFLGTRDAGLYVVAVAAAMLVRAQGASIGIVALPTVASAPNAAERIERIGSVFRLAVLFNLGTAVIVIAVAGLAVPTIYGVDFVPAVPIVRVLMVGAVAASLRQLLGDCLRGSGQPLLATWAELSSWLAALLGLVILMPPLGAIGAALSVSISYLTALFVQLVFASRMGISWRQLFAPSRTDLWLASRVAEQVASPLRPIALRLRGVRRTTSND